MFRNMNCSSAIFLDLDHEPVSFGVLRQLSFDGRIVFASVCALFALLALLSNGFVIFAVYAHKPLYTRSSNLWLSSLAVTDIVIALFVAPVAIYYNIFGAWTLGLAGCVVSTN